MERVVRKGISHFLTFNTFTTIKYIIVRHIA